MHHPIQATTHCSTLLLLKAEKTSWEGFARNTFIVNKSTCEKWMNAFFSRHQISAQIGGFHGKIQKVAVNHILPKLFGRKGFLLLPLSIETWSFNLLQRIFPVLGSKGASPHLENPPWCAISFKLRTVRRSSCLGSNLQLDWSPIWISTWLVTPDWNQWLMLILTAVTRNRVEASSDWCHIWLHLLPLSD